MTSDKARSTEARLNTMIPYTYGTLNTHTTNITANTTSITGLNTRLGSNSQQTYLGSITQMPTIGTPSGSAAHSGVGTVSGTPTGAEFTALNSAYNNTADFVNAIATALAGVISELRAANLMS